MVLAVECNNYYQSFATFNHIAIFPVFYSADRNATNHQLLIESLNKDLTCVEMDQVYHLSIYLNSSNMSTIRALAMDMDIIFPNIFYLNLYVERRCELEPVSFYRLLIKITSI